MLPTFSIVTLLFRRFNVCSFQRKSENNTAIPLTKTWIANADLQQVHITLANGKTNFLNDIRSQKN